MLVEVPLCDVRGAEGAREASHHGTVAADTNNPAHLHLVPHPPRLETTTCPVHPFPASLWPRVMLAVAP